MHRGEYWFRCPLPPTTTSTFPTHLVYLASSHPTLCLHELEQACRVLVYFGPFPQKINRISLNLAIWALPLIFSRLHLTTFTFLQFWDSNKTTSWDYDLVREAENIFRERSRYHSSEMNDKCVWVKSCEFDIKLISSHIVKEVDRGIIVWRPFWGWKRGAREAALSKAVDFRVRGGWQEWSLFGCDDFFVRIKLRAGVGLFMVNMLLSFLHHLMGLF